MPIACDKCRENLALLIEPKTSDSATGAFARAAEAADGETPRPAATPALEAAERAELEAHIAACPDCARELALLRAMIGELQTLPIAAAPASLRSRIRAEIAAEGKKAAPLRERAATPAWVSAWRNFFRSPGRVAWASGMAMAAFAVFMMRDQPISTVSPTANPDFSARQPLIASAPSNKRSASNNEKIGSNSAKAPASGGSSVRVSSPAATPIPGAAVPSAPSTGRVARSSDTVPQERAQRRAAAPVTTINGDTSALSKSAESASASAAAAQTGPAAASAPAATSATSPQATPLPVAKSAAQDQRFARITVLPEQPEPAAVSGIQPFALPEKADALPGATMAAPEGTTDRHPLRMRGGGEVDSMAPPAGMAPAAPIAPPAAMAPPRPGRERILSRGIGNVAEIEKAAPGNTKSALPTQIAPGAESHGLAGGAHDTPAPTQRYSAQQTEREDGKAGQPVNPAIASDSNPAAMAAPAPAELQLNKGMGAKPKANLKIAGGPAANALPVGRQAEIEVKLTAAQSTARAEARVALPLGLRFTTRAFEKAQTVWSGPVTSNKPLNVRFKVTGAQSGLWPVDVTLQKPDGTKLDTMTVKVTVVP